MRRLNALIAMPAVAGFGLLTAVALIAAPASLSATTFQNALATQCSAESSATAEPRVVAGIQLSADQMHNAQVIVAVVRARHLPGRAAQIALMTAMQESSLTVLHHGDAAGPDSRGLFQQRDSWGRLQVRLDPASATGLFLDRLVAVPSWRITAPASVAHDVQHNANAHDYVKWIGLSRELARQLFARDPVHADCASDSVTVSGVPTRRAHIALTAAAAMLGKPYCWDGGDATGPTHGAGGSGCGSGSVGFDCSGLVLYAWAKAGIDLPHLASAQASVGRRIPLAEAQPGDLAFLADRRDSIHHVAMIWSISPGTTTGAGQVIEAEDFNVPVHIRPWQGTAEPGVVPFAVRLTG